MSERTTGVSERTTGVMFGGALALAGAVLGFYITYDMLTLDFWRYFDFIYILTRPWGLAAWIVGIASIIVLILSLIILSGKWLKWSIILVLVFGLLSLIGFFGEWYGILPGILQVIGAIIALIGKRS